MRRRPRTVHSVRGGVARPVALAWLVFFTALQWSVVRYRIPIVAALTAATLALALLAVGRLAGHA